MTALGSVLGLAYGDSVGKEVEFMSYRNIVTLHGRRGPRNLARGGRVTDDTQMMLAVGEALVALREQLDRRAKRSHGAAVLRPADVELALVNRFINWYEDPQNNRAPGATCLRACAALADGKPWWEAADKRSKGCGANMRVTVVGLCDWLSQEERSAIAQFQAALTHAHPTALAAADLTQQAVWLLNHGTHPDELLDLLEDYCLDRGRRWHGEWLGELWAWTGVDKSAEMYLICGWREMVRAIRRVRHALAQPDRGGDVCESAGQGWSADEAIAAALLAFLRHPDDATLAVRRGAATNGDSDSIACLAGALAGAHLNETSFPENWRQQIEYRGRLEAVWQGLV